jgi:succinate dehydrogenase/fumarate reductase flavoprotein subunit
MVNSNGDRFVDEGSDFRNFTYAKFGRAILYQPGGFAFQVWDRKTASFLRKEEYGDGIVEKIVADSVEELAKKLWVQGLQNPDRFIKTIKEYNEAVQHHRNENLGVVWNPAVKDGLSTQSSTYSLDLPKSNWALSIDESPYIAVKVTCGITFTFGGFAINPETAGVVDASGQVMPGLFCAGEMVGGLFYGATNEFTVYELISSFPRKLSWR